MNNNPPSPEAGSPGLREAIAKIIALENLDGNVEMEWRAWCNDDQRHFLAQADLVLAILPRGDAPAATTMDPKIALINEKCGEMCRVFDALGFQMHPMDDADPIAGGLPERVRWAKAEIEKLRATPQSVDAGPRTDEKAITGHHPSCHGQYPGNKGCDCGYARRKPRALVRGPVVDLEAMAKALCTRFPLGLPWTADREDAEAVCNVYRRLRASTPPKDPQ